MEVESDMMNDDEKKNNSTETQDEAKLADVIDLDEAREKKDEAKADSEAKQQVTLEEAVAALKGSFAELKAQFAPLKATLTNIVDAAKSGAEAARVKMELDEKKAEEEAKDGEAKRDDVIADAAAALTPDEKAVKETSEVINLTLERLKRRGIERKIDLKSVLQDQFTKFADKNLKENDYTVDEDGKKVVKVDADFFSNHGSEAIPEILGGVARSVVNTLFGDILGMKDAKADDAKADEAKDGEAEVVSDSEADAETEEKAEPKYKVQFDFAKMVGEAIKKVNAQSTPANHTPEEEAQAREAAAKGVQIVEDVLNGKDPSERLEKEARDAEIEANNPTPDAINPVDEKHQRILDLAKEYDQAMKDDDDDK